MISQSRLQHRLCNIYHMLHKQHTINKHVYFTTTAAVGKAYRKNLMQSGEMLSPLRLLLKKH